MKEKEIKEILDTFEFEDACLSCGDWNKSACYCMNKDPHKCYKVHQIANLFPEPPEEVLLSVDEVCNPKVELCSDLLFHIEELAAIGLIKGDKADEKEYDKRVEELTRGFKIAKAQQALDDEKHKNEIREVLNAIDEYFDCDVCDICYEDECGGELSCTKGKYNEPCNCHVDKNRAKQNLERIIAKHGGKDDTGRYSKRTSQDG